MATYQVMAWHGIPTGVRAKDADGSARESLPLRFQAAVDAVAAATGHAGSSQYVAGFAWSAPVERGGSAREVAQAVAAELEDAYPPGRVRALRHAILADLAPANTADLAE